MTLVAIGSNMPGYLPDNPESVHIVHLDTDEDYSDALSIMFSDMWRDGDSSLESAEDPTSEDASGDAGMLELIERGDRYQSGELWNDLMSDLKRNGEANYWIDWTIGQVSYWIMATDETECSDEYCDECHPEVGDAIESAS